MINNIDYILPRFSYKEDYNELFMHCQIVRRAKDHKEKVKSGVIKAYFIRSAAHLKELMPEIILLCEHYGARAYINIAEKGLSELYKLALQKLTADVCNNTVRKDPMRIFNSAAGELKSRSPLWIVDVDDMSTKQSVRGWLYNWYFEEYKKGPDIHMPKTYFAERSIVDEIPTRAGCHLIVRPFDSLKFKEVFPNIDIHKNSMGTLLYYPDSVDNG